MIICDAECLGEAKAAEVCVDDAAGRGYWYFWRWFQLYEPIPVNRVRPRKTKRDAKEQRNRASYTCYIVVPSFINYQLPRLISSSNFYAKLTYMYRSLVNPFLEVMCHMRKVIIIIESHIAVTAACVPRERVLVFRNAPADMLRKYLHTFCECTIVEVQFFLPGIHVALASL